MCGDNLIRVYHVLQPDEIKELEESMKVEGERIFDNEKLKNVIGVTGESGIAEAVSEFDKVDPFKRISFFGFLKRTTTDRCIDVKFTRDGSLFAIQSSGKVIEFFNVHNSEEITKKQKRRQKRTREKIKKRQEAGDNVEAEPFAPKPSDEYSSKQVHCQIFGLPCTHLH